MLTNKNGMEQQDHWMLPDTETDSLPPNTASMPIVARSMDRVGQCFAGVGAVCLVIETRHHGTITVASTAR